LLLKIECIRWIPMTQAMRNFLPVGIDGPDAL
jgi:hypothetical protein